MSGSVAGHLVVTKSPNPLDRRVGQRVRMRRKMLNMSQTELASELGLTFQQVQKYEKGVNRIGASRLQHMSHVLQVPVAFFFEDPVTQSQGPAAATTDPSLDYVSDFLSSSDGLNLVSAFMRVRDIKLRRLIVDLVETLANYRNARAG